MALESLHFSENLVGFEHGDGGLLEGDIGSSVKVGSTRADGLDEFLVFDQHHSTRLH